MLVGFTTGRELHPAPKVVYSVDGIILQIAQQQKLYLKEYVKPLKAQGRRTPPLAGDDKRYALMMAVSATGQTAWHCGLSKWPTHSTQVAASIT
jgi:hypothetical protein